MSEVLTFFPSCVSALTLFHSFPLSLQGSTAIAHVLLAAWARGEAIIPGGEGNSSVKGRM